MTGANSVERQYIIGMVYYLGIVLISCATLLVELSLLRLFAVQQFYHFAFMAISLALLGAGASGSLLSMWRRPFSPAGLCLAFGTTTIGAYLVVNYLPFDSFSIAWDGRQVIYLALYFLVISIPFLFSGLLIGSELMHAGSRDSAGSHRVYGANLIGSALGSLLSLPVLSLMGGEGSVILAAVVGASAGWLFTGEKKDSTTLNLGDDLRRRARLYHLAIGGLVLGGMVVLFNPPSFLSLQLSPYKTLSTLSQALDARHTYSNWDASARVDVVESKTIHVMPGLSLLSPLQPPVQAGLLIDGDSLMPIIRLSPDTEQAAILADHLPGGIVSHLRPAGRTLILEPGSGAEVLFALAAGASHVTAVEDNSLIIDVMQNAYRGFSSELYHDNRVTIVNQSGRVFARQSKSDRYDVVILALTDPHRPVTSGAYGLTENYLYTVEAVADYLTLLDEDGILVVTRWLQVPPSESGRLFGTLVTALAKTGRNPSKHLLAFRSLRTMTVLTSSRPYSAAEMEIARNFMSRRGFDAVYFPGIRPEEVNQFNVLPEPSYYQLFGDILNDPDATYANYRFDIRPPIDDHPFFFHFFRWRQTPEILAALGRTWQPFGGSGFFVLVALLGLVALASAIFILGPLTLSKTPHPHQPAPVRYWQLRVFAYFAGLGLAFLFVEIPLAQRFILVLGQPVTALAVVIFSILIFSGFGSLAARRRRFSWGLAALPLVVAMYPMILEPITALALQWPQWGRVLLTILALAPLGFLMGLPFVIGLRLVELRDASLVPWAWAINGSFSVISAVLAVIVALSWGFTTVLWLGASAYALGLLAFANLPHPD